MLCSSRKGRPRATYPCLLTQHKLPDLALRLLFAPYKEGNPALTNQQTPSVNSLFLLTLVYKNLSSSTALYRSFLSARLDVVPFVIDWTFIRSVNCRGFFLLTVYMNWTHKLSSIFPLWRLDDSESLSYKSPMPKLGPADMSPVASHGDPGW